MSYSAKNYAEHGGDKTVIGGTLEIKEGATVTGLPSSSFTPAENQAASTAEDITSLVADFNALILKLKTAGLMETD
ncbi:Head fiber protein [Listeria innocua]|nr:Head fiber protein [Listeria innocua]EKP0378212.1 Head fiber protein [Listeria innocua]